MTVERVAKRFAEGAERVVRMVGMLVGGGWCRRGHRSFADLAIPGSARQKLLNAAYRVAVLVQQAVDAMRERNIGWTVIAPVAGPLKGTQLRETRFPIAQDMLRNPKFVGEFADGSESLLAFAGWRRQGVSRP